jgi:transcriptional regulator with XRE-family HTH domain
MTFSRKLATLRKQNGLTQQAMSKKLGIHVSQIKRYEAGTSLPTLEVFRKIVLALNISSDLLLFEQERGAEDDLRLHFEAISKLDPDEKKTIKDVLEGMLLKHEAKKLRELQKQPI